MDCKTKLQHSYVTTLSILLCSLIPLFLAACRTDPLENAKLKVPIGMPREEAIRILRSEAWYYQPCINQSSIDDLFFFGSHRYDEAEIVIVTNVNDNASYRVIELGSFESYAWQAAYRDCVDREKFQSRESWINSFA